MSLGARRRYLCVAAGAYPPPTPPRPRGPGATSVQLVDRSEFAGEPEPTLEGPLDPFAPFADEEAVAAAPAAPARTAEGVLSAAAPAPDEPDLGALLSGPVSPTFASLGADYAAARGPVEGEADEPAGTWGETHVTRGGSRLGGVVSRRMLIGAVAGALLGLVAGIALLALLPGRAGGLDWNPVTLWQTSDSRMRLTAGLVAVGFALLGAAFCARGGSSREPS